MKKLLLAALLLSTTVFAQKMPDIIPRCNNDKVTYMHFPHMVTDFCIHGLKITDVVECEAKLDDKESHGVLKGELEAYMKVRHKEICGK